MRPHRVHESGKNLRRNIGLDQAHVGPQSMVCRRALDPGLGLRIGGRCLQGYVPHGGQHGDGDNQRNCGNEHCKNQAWPHQQHSTIYKTTILPRLRLHSTEAGSQFR